MTTNLHELMNTFDSFINTADEQLGRDIVAEDAVFHIPARKEPVIGPAGYLDVITMMRGGFPDIQWALDETIAEGYSVAARFTMRGDTSEYLFPRTESGAIHRSASAQYLQISQ